MSKRGRMKAGGKMPKWNVEFRHVSQHPMSPRWFVHKRAVSEASAEELAKSIVGQRIRLGAFDVTVEKVRINGPDVMREI